MTTTRREGAHRAVMAALLALVGCTGGPAPAPTDEARPPSPSVSPGRALPVHAHPSPTSPTSLASPADPGPSPAALAPGATLTDLVTPMGSAFALSDTSGAWRIVFFGYTHCPDVCPTTIGELMEVLAARPDTRVIFVSIDPARDTPEALAEWSRYLPEGLVGLTGSPTAVRRAADGFGVTYARVDTGSRAGYAMAHTADSFLLDPQGALRTTYPFGTPSETIVADLDRLGSADQEAS